MRIFVWALRLCAFLIFVALAVRNLEPATLVLFADYKVQAPLVLMLLGAFLVGVVLCAISLFWVFIRQRREVLHLSTELHAATARQEATATVSTHSLLPPAA